MAAASLLLCRPAHYTIAYEINPWMHLRRQVRQQRAMRQWLALYRTLTRQLHIDVRLIRPAPGFPDLVFTPNAGLVHQRTVLLSRFRHPQRQGEAAVFARYFESRGYRVIRPTGAAYFEGEGDALWMGTTLVLGFRFRSDAAIHTQLARAVRREVLPVELTDKRFYHLDTCFCPLDRGSALWFPKAFDRYGRRVIERLVREPIAVSEADAQRFACNAIVVGNAVVLQTGCSKRLTSALERRGFRVYPVDLSEFLKAGGSAKCLALRLTHADYLPK